MKGESNPSSPVPSHGYTRTRRGKRREKQGLHTATARPPRVMFLLNHAGAGGTERYIELLVERLCPEKMDALLVYHEDGPLRTRLEARGIPCLQVPMKNRFDVRAAVSLARLCRERQVDVVHAMFLREHYLAWMAGAFGCRAARMTTVHLMLDHPARPPLLWLDRAVYRSMGAVVAVCGALAGQLTRAYGLPAGFVRTIHNGVAPDDVDTMARHADREAVRREFGLSENAVVFLSAGRLSEEKGFSFLLEAIRLWHARALQKSREDLSPLAGAPEKHAPWADRMADMPVRFLLAGDGPMREALHAERDAAGLTEQVVFAGYRKDMRRLLHAADVYVAPSRTEALSMSILEAMAAGLPVVATSVGGTPELISTREPVNGLLVSHDDGNALAEALQRLAADKALRVRMGAEGERMAGEQFNLARMAAETAAVYAALVGE